MTPQAAAALRCPVCGGALMPLGTSLRCPQGHSYDIAKEGYVNLLAIQKRHAADPGDGKAMVRARRAFLQAGYYAPFQKALAELCLEYAPECGETHLLDAGCGEGSYDRVVYDAFAAQGRPCVLAGFDLSKDAIRLAAKLLPEAAFAVGGSFSAPVRDGWADVLLNIFSPFAEQEFCRVLRSGGVLLYAVPTARHLYGLKEVLYDEPYENAEQQTEYSGFTLIDIQYYLRFWLSICRTSLAVSALRIVRYCLKTTGTTLRAAMRQKAVPVILCVVTGRPGPGSAFRPPGRERRSSCQAGRCGWQGFRRQWSAGPGGHRQGYKVPGRCEAPG